ncbi:DUF2891 domain-containing protein [Paracrocinitomix mangrovi]|uniref:DUF2891 domain-containing protein n=1 Tax=Paracrocinitomix mangrovi TaxID=2862509 RepID=UPI001C8DAD14|nr:DUF2891 domain-containing protein [Paracrocinitomix mangrovi]UKN03338.1 DUF2891 domain-containing protein [Paracrocinitomix mangrovi]
MKRILFFVFAVGLKTVFGQVDTSYEKMYKLAKVPIECIHKEYPNKLNQTLTDSSHLQSPSELHPIFYGCFDWHSSVHGHWLLASLLNKYPGTTLEKEVIDLFDEQFQIPKVQKELLYFMPKLNKSFERTYGWAWILKLQVELKKSKHNSTHKLSENLQSLVDEIVKNYKTFLPKMVYPIRVGEHTNTAFGLSFALDYAREIGDKEFEELIIKRAKDFYLSDNGCPISWEPSGFDFISPCLQEAELMSKVLDEKDFKKWLESFMPQLFDSEFTLEPGKVLDRTDGKLVHLDGLNFSRAWCLYNIAKKLPKKLNHLNKIGDEHINSSKEQVLGSDYMGSHWLASFLVYALICQ